MRMILLGAPGSGKGTQSQLMVERYQVPQISTGDLLRAAVAAGTALGKKAKVVMDAGQLVSDEIVLAMIGERLSQADARRGFILDGFPRNLAQVQALEVLLAGLGKPLDLVLLIDVEVDTLLQRLSGRRTCTTCNYVYNIYTTPPKMDGRCDKCGGSLRQRADDTEETISNRLRVYESQTLPVVEYYRKLDKLRRVQGVGEVKDVFKAVAKICEAIKKGARVAAKLAETRRNASTDNQGRSQKAAKEQPVTKQPVKKKVISKKKPNKKKAAAKKKVTKKKASRKKSTVKPKATVKKKSAVKRKKTKKKTAKRKLKAKTRSRVVAKKKAREKSAAKKRPAARNKIAKKKRGAKRRTRARNR
ncbi:MAG: adenylate kinase [Gammaproteobacteria bacterium]